MDAHSVVELLAALHDRDLSAWVAGGWGVDAIVGQQTRPHGDLDLAVNADQWDRITALLDELGFVRTVDWFPVRIEMTAPDGRRVDLHPVCFAPDGSGVQSGLDGASFFYAADGFTAGVIDGVSVPCLSVRQQLSFREGYELRDVDRHDLPLLRARA